MFELDHIVHYTDNPEGAAATLKELGVYSNPGGRHENFGTYNILSYFDHLSYIELIGSFDKKLVRKSAEEPYTLWNQFETNNYRDNLERIAIRHDDLESLADSLKAYDLDVYGPYPYSRTTPDGNEINWELLYAIDKNSQVALPFFIDWKRSNEERETDLIESGAIKSHNRGALSLNSVGFVAEDAETIFQNWSQYFGLEIGKDVTDDELNATGKTLIIGNKRLIFYEPKGEGMAQKYLKEQGEGPFLIDILGSDEEDTVEINGAFYRFKK